MIREVIFLGDEKLHQKSKFVENIPQEKELIEDMIDTMYANNGIGLAAVQVGILKRIFIVDIEEYTDGAMVFVNPEIVEKSLDTFTYKEGCLSIPSKLKEEERPCYEITRPRSIKIQFQDLRGKEQSLVAEDLFATCIQHEYDHLNGILFIDHIQNLESRKEMALLLKKNNFQYQWKN